MRVRDYGRTVHKEGWPASEQVQHVCQEAIVGRGRCVRVGDDRIGDRLTGRGRKGIQMQSYPGARGVNRRNHDHLCAAGAPNIGRRSGVAVLLIDRWEVSLPKQPPASIEFVQGGLLAHDRPLPGLAAGHADNIDRSVGPHDRRGFDLSLIQDPLFIRKLASPDLLAIGPQGEERPLLIANVNETALSEDRADAGREGPGEVIGRELGGDGRCRHDIGEAVIAWPTMRARCLGQDQQDPSEENRVNMTLSSQLLQLTNQGIIRHRIAKLN